MPWQPRLTWADHALKQMRYRRITKTHVRAVLASPVNMAPSPVGRNRIEVTGLSGHPGRRITVIIEPFTKTTRVITAYLPKTS